MFCELPVYCLVLPLFLTEPKVKKKKKKRKPPVNSEKAVKERLLFTEHPAILRRDLCGSGDSGVSKRGINMSVGFFTAPSCPLLPPAAPRGLPRPPAAEAWQRRRKEDGRALSPRFLFHRFCLMNDCENSGRAEGLGMSPFCCQKKRKGNEDLSQPVSSLKSK